LLKTRAATPAANHLFEINAKAPKLSEEKAEIFHHLVAKLLYLCKRTRPDIILPVAFLCTRVQKPDEDDFKKLGRCLSYLQNHPDIPLTLEASKDGVIKWWVDASFAVHSDYKSHTGACMSLGKGCPINISSKQKINTRSSTEAELVGVNDVLALILWVRHFLEAQGFTITDNVVYQDNMSSILLEKNGRQSSGKKTRHIEIRYFFITDNVRRKKASIEHCPTEEMVSDTHTKPTQGALFRKHRSTIMNLPTTPPTGPQECVEADGIQTPLQNQTQPAESTTKKKKQQAVANHTYSTKNISSCNRSYLEVAKIKKGALNRLSSLLVSNRL